jgi:hypothetical protein
VQLFDQTGRALGDNDDWSGTTELVAATDRVGAFRLTSGSADAAMLMTLAPGSYTAHVTTSGTSGIALLEIYDATTSSATERLINLSTRGTVETGEGQLVAGLVVSGNAPKRLLIRGIGPALGGFGVSGFVVDPQLKVFATGNATALAQNDNWETPLPVSAGQAVASASEISAANTAAGAFALAAGSRDAAVVVTLPPGNYSVVVSGANGSTGTGLVEVFELPAP